MKIINTNQKVNKSIYDAEFDRIFKKGTHGNTDRKDDQDPHSALDGQGGDSELRHSNVNVSNRC